MALLGLLLFAACVAAAVSIAVSNTESAPFEVFGETVTDLSPGGLMLVGVGLGALAVLSLWMIAAGMRHARRRRETNRTVVQATRSRVDELEEENIRLREAANRRQATEPSVPATAMPTTSVAGSSSSVGTGYDHDAAADREVVADRGALADRDEARVTPAMATAPEPIDVRRSDDRTSDDSYTDGRTVYPDDASTGLRTDQGTPAFDETAKQQEGRVFGRRNK